MSREPCLLTPRRRLAPLEEAEGHPATIDAVGTPGSPLAELSVDSLALRQSYSGYDGHGHVVRAVHPAAVVRRRGHGWWQHWHRGGQGWGQHGMWRRWCRCRRGRDYWRSSWRTRWRRRGVLRQQLMPVRRLPLWAPHRTLGLVRLGCPAIVREAVRIGVHIQASHR